MSHEKEPQPYTPEEPVSPATIKKDQQEIRRASRNAAREMAAEELGENDPPLSKQQAEKELLESAKKIQKEEA